MGHQPHLGYSAAQGGPEILIGAKCAFLLFIISCESWCEKFPLISIHIYRQTFLWPVAVPASLLRLRVIKTNS